MYMIGYNNEGELRIKKVDQDLFTNKDFYDFREEHNIEDACMIIDMRDLFKELEKEGVTIISQGL